MFFFLLGPSSRPRMVSQIFSFFVAGPAPVKTSKNMYFFSSAAIGRKVKILGRRSRLFFFSITCRFFFLPNPEEVKKEKLPPCQQHQLVNDSISRLQLQIRSRKGGAGRRRRRMKEGGWLPPKARKKSSTKIDFLWWGPNQYC